MDYKGDFCINYCCKGNTGIRASENALGDLHKLWNNERIQLIRNTVNDFHGWYQNKLCMKCRCVDEYWDDEKRNRALKAFNIKTKDALPVYFDDLYID